MDYRRYETLILLSPNLSPEQVEAFKGKIEGVLAEGQGQIVRFEEWGRRRLAYPVRKEIHGYYVLWDYRAEPPLAAELQRVCKIDEQVFKYLTIVIEAGFTEERYQQVLDQLAAEASRTEKERESSAAKADAAKGEAAKPEGGEADDEADDDAADDDDEAPLGAAAPETPPAETPGQPQAGDQAASN
jgi:small subunit ribosomal protein S6